MYSQSSVHYNLYHIPLLNHPCEIPSDTSVYYDEVLTLVAKCTIIPVAVLVELLISMYTVKKHYDTKQRYAGCRCSSMKHYLLLSFHIATCIMEYSDYRTTLYHDCYPTGRTATNPPASYYRLYNNCATNNSWFSTHCCLCAVSVSKTKKEKFPEQCKVLWNCMCVLCHDYCNHRTHSRTACPVRTDAAGASTNWNWSEGSISVIASIVSTVCTGMVLEEEIPEEKEVPEEIGD